MYEQRKYSEGEAREETRTNCSFVTVPPSASAVTFSNSHTSDAPLPFGKMLSSPCPRNSTELFKLGTTNA